VFWLWRRFAGSVCGFVAVLVLFTIDSILYEHGIRGNHMEAPLMLAYCGAIYHFIRWDEEIADRRRRGRHALAAGLYFTLGFMTKFVAIFFLPVICALALVWRRDALQRVRAGWRDWLIPALVVILLSAPWFIYQARRDFQALWDVMVAEHVVTRFTGSLDPMHQKPWHYYYSQLWSELAMVGSQWIVLLGAALLAVKAWRGQPWSARLLLLWWVVPITLMSMGTSKLFHYAHPFLPPLAIGAGAAAALLVDALDRLVLRIVGGTTGPFRWLQPGLGGRISGTALRRVLVGVAMLGIALAVWTFLAGRVLWKINGVQLLKNSTVWRPMVAAAVLLWLAGSTRFLSRGVAIAAMAVMLPVMGYRVKLNRIEWIDHPLRTLRDCALTVHEPRPVTHVFPPYVPYLSHTTYYYLRPVGPWLQHERPPTSDDLRARLFVPGQESLVVLFVSDYEALKAQIASGAMGAVAVPSGLLLSDDVALLTPGPFKACGEAALAGTLRPLRVGPAPDAKQ